MKWGQVFYALLLLASIAFVVSCLYLCLPWRSQPRWIQAHGWWILLLEVAVVIVLGVVSMGWGDEKQGPGSN